MKALTMEEIINRIPKLSRFTIINLTSHVGADGRRYRMALVKCSCGNIRTRSLSCLLTGKVLSCGCYNVELIRSKGRTIDEMNLILPKNSRWTIIRFHSYKELKTNGTHYKMVLARCKCGNERVMAPNVFISGRSLSCGCYHKEVVTGSKIYSHSIPQLNGCYRQMLARCYDPKSKQYNNYGGRGVKVCDEWKNSYQAFLTWSLENGWRHGLQLDKDIIGDGMLYSPSTCKWVTRFENMAHRRTSVKYLYKGKYLTIREIVNLENFSENKCITNLKVKVNKNGKSVLYRGCLFIQKL